MVTAFEKLARPVQKWVRSQGWKELRPIQADATHVLCDQQNDLIVSASTAGGKTEAAFLPLISQVLDHPVDKSGFDLVYIGPLKALITDQTQRLKDVCKDVELPVFPWHGDISASVKSRALKASSGILLITPESLEALFVRRGQDVPRLFAATRAIVIDELHTVLDTERGIQVRSLLTRLELAVGHSIRRVGLSATLGDMNMAREYLRPDNSQSVRLVEADGGDSELLLQLRGYVSGGHEEAVSPLEGISSHLFENLRGSDNLVFAGARDRVEIYADRLRQRCEDEHLPQEFYAHHANLSRDHRSFVEKRLKDSRQPTSAVCTSTLELGIDIGDVKCVAQIGAPFSVAALRQRLGRSGRKEGVPSILRQYAVESYLDSKSHVIDRLRLGLVRAIATIDLLLDKWNEPPRPESLHLSTLVHQVLSLIAERGGAHANRMFRVLCVEGPFRQVDQSVFQAVLRAIGRPDIELVEQAADGLLLLGKKGEWLVEHYSFYAVFKTSEEFRLICDGKELGVLPIDNVITKGATLIFSGRRWHVQDIHEKERVILVKPAREGVPPMFGGDPGVIHDNVTTKMFALLESKEIPTYIDSVAIGLLAEARTHYSDLNFSNRCIMPFEINKHIVATRSGTIKTNTLALALAAKGFLTETYDGFLIVEENRNLNSLHNTLSEFATHHSIDLFMHKPNLEFEKFHRYLTDELLRKDALSSRLDMESLSPMCKRIIAQV